MTPTLGVCYYPEHWPEEVWAEDASRMAALGLTWVRIGEFAWSRMEPEPGRFDWNWLDRAMDVLGQAGLRVVLGTPTATPPRWMVDRHPDMLAHDVDGGPRKFGSRRHYDFAHEGYRADCVRIAEALARRYGDHPALGAWQIDNEYGCHDTTVSYGPASTAAFRDWLAQRYQSVSSLNRAWGNVFWSMDYDDFDQIAPPNLTVTEPNPSHVLDWRRFASDMVVAFNRLQADAIARHSAAPMAHNYMGRVLDFDHWAVGADLQIASWDSYPIGFLSDRLEATVEEKARFMRQGHPDCQAFHHDLYRGVGRGRWWVMEQQPGPVNWAPYNPAPLPGMCRLWAWEAFAHGAECVSYFRWRQAPFAQEQMHGGLLNPDRSDAPVVAEVAQVAREIAEVGPCEPGQARVAIVFDYASAWAWEAQPHGADFDYFRLVFAAYRALRRLGQSIDIVPPDCGDLSPYRLVLAPGLLTAGATLTAALDRFDGLALLGPRSDLKTAQLTIPDPMGPNLPGLDTTVTTVESLPPGAQVPLAGGLSFRHWFEHLTGSAPVRLATAAGQPAIVGDRIRYLAGWPCDDSFVAILSGLLDETGIDWQELSDGLRIRDTATHRFVFNYAPEPKAWEDVSLPPGGVHWSPRP